MQHLPLRKLLAWTLPGPRESISIIVQSLVACDAYGEENENDIVEENKEKRRDKPCFADRRLILNCEGKRYSQPYAAPSSHILDSLIYLLGNRILRCSQRA